MYAYIYFCVVISVCVCVYIYIYIYIYINAGSLIEWVECSVMAREIGIQSQVESYQRLKKWYLMPLCLVLSVKRYGSRVNGAIQEK